MGGGYSQGDQSGSDSDLFDIRLFAGPLLNMPRVTASDFDRIVERGLSRIDPRFRRRMQNVILVVEPEPPKPGLLGLYQGRPLTERSVSEPFAVPDRITIYQGPHERMARSMGSWSRSSRIPFGTR